MTGRVLVKNELGKVIASVSKVSEHRHAIGIQRKLFLLFATKISCENIVTTDSDLCVHNNYRSKYKYVE